MKKRQKKSKLAKKFKDDQKNKTAFYGCDIIIPLLIFSGKSLKKTKKMGPMGAMGGVPNIFFH